MIKANTLLKMELSSDSKMKSTGTGKKAGKSSGKSDFNSIISTKLGISLGYVNTFANNYLTESLSSTIQQLNEIPLKEDTRVDLLKIQDLFQELYYLAGAQNAGEIKKQRKTYAGVGKNNGGSLPKVPISKLKTILEKVKDINLGQQLLTRVGLSDEVVSIGESLNNFINLYLLIIIYSQISDLLVERTISLNENLLYWDNLDSSTLLKLTYLLQVLPARMYDLGKSIAEDCKQRIVSKSSDCPVSALLIERGIDEGPSHTEEDNDLFHFFNQVYVLVDTLWISTKKTVQNVLDSLSIPTYLFLKMNTSTLVSNSIDGETDNCFQKLGIYLRIIVGAPIRSVSFEIRARKSLITENIDNIAYNLGNLIQKLPGKNFNELDTIKTFITTGRNEDVKSIVDRMEIILDISASKAAKTISSRLFDICTTLECYKESNVASPPSFLTRHWPILLLLLKFGPQFSFGFYNNRDEIYRWIRCNLFDTVTGFLKDWLIKPMYDMLSVIRHDDSSSELSITTKESLQSDLDSLERMVIDYTIDYENPMVTKDLPAFQKEIHNAVKEGNLTVLMSKYEQDIRTPFKSTIKGSLPRALLIQLQKTKVDGAIAINGIDKLLKSQQLVFGMVSISPSIFIVYQLWQFARSQIFDKPLVINGKQVNLVCLKCLNNIEKYLNIYSEVGEEQKVYIEGFILIEILNLKRQSLKILPNNIHEMWISDLNDVNDDEWSIEGRLRIMSRLWSVYGHYFK